MKPTATVVELDVEQMQRQLDQIEQTLGEETSRPFRILLSWYVWLLQLIEQKDTTIRRLRRLLFGFRTERLSSQAASSGAPDKPGEQSQPQPDASQPGEPSSGEPSSGAATRRRRRRPRVGHGRISAEDYTGCQRMVVTHQTYVPGDACPFCQDGTLYRQSRWAFRVRLVGNPPVTGTRYELERLRCGSCDRILTAEMPEEAGPDKHDATVASTIATLHYGQGMPFARIEKLQRWAGIPLPASVQWELVRDALAHGVKASYEQLLCQAAQGQLVHNDDTHMRILELSSRLQQGQPLREDAPKRSGVFTTSILSMADGRPPIALFFTGPRHSGENLRDLLQRRLEGLPPPLQMCDALSRNMPSDLATIVGNCLAHARRNFYDLADIFPPEVRYVLGRLREVYRIDAKAKEENLSPEERLRLHQQHSGPVMQRLRDFLLEQLDQRLVEPNSSLGQAIAYLLRHWDKLTLFLREAGAPLDNNICERALKMAIRHRKNSLFYQTQNGADVGDIYMSLIHTCNLSQADPSDYLTKLQQNEQPVEQAPKLWLPWNYRQQIDSG